MQQLGLQITPKIDPEQPIKTLGLLISTSWLNKGRLQNKKNRNFSELGQEGW